MSHNHTRRGTLIIVVAGMSALLATLAVTFAVKVRGEANGADQMVRIAQARILLNAFMAYSIYNLDFPTAPDPDPLKGINPNFFGNAYPVKWQPADPDRQATFNTAWMVIKSVSPDATDPTRYTVQALFGSGPTQGDSPPTLPSDIPPYRLTRRYEPRYMFNVTFAPGGVIPAHNKIWISKITSTEITE